MDYRYMCVMDEYGRYITYVLVHTDGDVECYSLKSGEQLIDTDPPTQCICAKWDGSTWVEIATEEEIAAAQSQDIW